MGVSQRAILSPLLGLGFAWVLFMFASWSNLFIQPEYDAAGNFISDGPSVRPATYLALIGMAVSRSQRNTADEFVQFLTWSVESERLAGPIVELVDHRLDRVVRDAVEVGALRVVVANETVQILVRSALPGRVWVAEKYGASRRDCELAMPRHFLSLIPGQSLPELFGEAHDLVPENVDHGGRVAGARKSSY
jgi:hypothetical protein